MSGQMIIGIASTVVPCNGKGQSKAPFFERMALHAQQRGAKLLLFHPEHADFSRHLVRGYTMMESQSGVWHKELLRVPDVIYENVFVHLAVQGMARPLRSYARARNIPVINPVLPGKAIMTRWVKGIPQSGMRVPETMTVASEGTIREMLARYHTVYVKPIGGYGGRGVLRVHKDGTSVVVESDRLFGQGRFSTSLSPTEWRRFFGRVIAKRPHIVQQQIPLMQLAGGNVDFRVVVQRGLDGAWRLVGIVPKVAPAQGVVTNLVAGGRRMRVTELRERLGGNKASLPIDRLEDSGIHVAKWLSSRYPTLGVIGYDLGVDKEGNVWFIELNPKPARRLLFADMSRRAGDLTVDFACYLAGRA